MIFANPVRTVIHPLAWTRPTGNRDFKVTQSFGCTGVKAEPALGSCAHYHRGLDISDRRCGSDVIAPADGTVRGSYRTGAGEHIITLNHGGGWVTSYGHLASRSVAKGATVKRGQKIGTIGATGNALGCHLHFGIKSNVAAGANYYADSTGSRQSPWPRLEQNVTVHPIEVDGVRIRDAADIAGALIAATKGGQIVRADGTDLGAVTDARKWGGSVIGGSYAIGGVPGSKWERIELDGAFRFMASPLAVLSAT